MGKCRGITTLFLFWFIIIITHGITLSVADGSQNKDEKPSATEKMREIYSLITSSSMTSWDKVKSLINQFQTQFFPPNLENGEEGGGGMVKEAAEKSLKTSKETVEESAKLAGEAVHKTAEKVKEGMPDTDGSHAEL